MNILHEYNPTNEIHYSYRIEKAIMMVNTLKNETMMCTEIIHAVDIHRKAIKLVYLIIIYLITIVPIHVIRPPLS